MINRLLGLMYKHNGKDEKLLYMKNIYYSLRHKKKKKRTANIE